MANIGLCNVCDRRTKRVDKYLECDTCKCHIHKKCLGLFSDDQFNHAKKMKSTWSCEKCNLSLFPFNTLEVEDDFSAAIRRPEGKKGNAQSCA